MIQTLGEFMARSNAHYYATRDPLGTEGDFITASEISQIFGEAIGLWVANEWMLAGSPAPFTLLEMGGGRGTLMADALRAIAQVMPDCARALRLHLLESSPVLRAKQQAALAVYTPVFMDDLSNLPSCPLIVIANEFFDALPIEQYRVENGQWFMRGVDNNSHYTDIAIDEPSVPNAICALAPPTWAEYNAAAVAITCTLAAHIKHHGGALLAIDYGHTATAAGETLQAVKRHRFANPLQDAGEIDLTAHVDFSVLAAAAAPLHTTLTTQAEFLHALGGRERLAALCANKESAVQESLRTGYARLTDADQMGTLFKVLIARAP